jgi:hypothetical protein
MSVTDLIGGLKDYKEMRKSTIEDGERIISIYAYKRKSPVLTHRAFPPHSYEKCLSYFCLGSLLDNAILIHSIKH